MRAAALSTGRSGLIFWTNLAGVVGLVAIVFSVANAASLTTIAYCLLLGELCSFAVGNLLLMRGRLALGVLDLWLRPMVFCGIAILIAVAERKLFGDMPILIGAGVSIVLAAAFSAAIAITSPVARKAIRTRRGGRG